MKREINKARDHLMTALSFYQSRNLINGGEFLREAIRTLDALVEDLSSTHTAAKALEEELRLDIERGTIREIGYMVDTLVIYLRKRCLMHKWPKAYRNFPVEVKVRGIKENV